MGAVKVGGGKYDSVAEALRQAKPGDTVSISGTHGEPLAIPPHLKGLAVMGTAGATITVPTGPAVFCGATGVTISGVAIAVGEGEAAVSVPGNGELALTSCEVRNGAGDGVQVFGQCTLTSCKVLECGAYGVSVLAGGEAATENTTIGLHKKTGVLSRGKGSRISLGAGTIVEKNKLHGVGADQGGSFTAISTTVRENGFVGVNLGDWGSGQLTDCKIYANGMHGIQCTGGSLSAANSSVAKSGKLGVFVNPPPPPVANPLGAPAEEQARANVFLSEVEVVESGIFGVHVTGGFLHASKCDVTRSGDSGMVAKGGYVNFERCSVSDNAKFGVSYGDKPDAQGSVATVSSGELKGCTVSGNTGVGVYCSGAVCALVSTKVLKTKMSEPPVQADGSGVSAVLGGLISVSGCKIAQNAGFGVFVHGGSEALKRPSGVSVSGSSVSHNGSYGASVAPASKETKGFSANLRISAFGSDFSNNPEGPVEGDFTKEMPVALYLGVAAVGVLALAYLLPRWKRDG